MTASAASDVVAAERTTTFAGSEGEVFFRRWDPPATPTAVVVVVHGYAEHGGRYAHVAEAFAARGWATVAPDHLGHGRSHGERALVADFSHVVDDLHTTVDLASSAYPGLPIVMVGHSMGGLLTARFVQRSPDRLDGAAFLGAVLGDWPWARAVLAEPSLPEEPSDPDGMSRDPAVNRSYAEDPLVYHGSYKRPLLVSEVATLDAFRSEIDRIRIPVACLHGSADPFVPPGPTVQAVLDMPSTDKVIRVYPGARHELVNETNRAEVLADLVAAVGRWVA